ncbi:MAG TPA: DUF5719 family protein [Streptosporangiaceae bacterium]
MALAALYGVAHFSTPSPANARVRVMEARRVDVVSSLVACPGAEMGGGATTRFGVVSPGAGSGAGRAEVRRAGAGGKRVAVLGRAGTGWFGDVTRPAEPLVVSGSGGLAAGLTSGQISVGKGGKGALSGTHCTRPATDSWFVGPGPEDGDLRLRVANPDDGPATVSVDVFSDVGELDESQAGAVFVPPHGSEVVSLATRARGARLAALHVRTSMGRVSAAVEAAGKGKAGADFVPGGSAPATSLVVPGVPGGSGGRDLLLAAPGDRDATVRVRAVTPNGTIVPGGDGVVQVPAGAVVPMPMDGMLSGRPCALTLTSDVPVVAGLRARSSYSGGGDVAYTAAEPPLDGRGVAAVNRGDQGYQASVVLTALGGGVTARVSTETARGTGSTKTVTIKSGRTMEVAPPVPHGSASGYGIAATRTSGTGRLYAARVLWRKVDGGKLLTLDPLESAAGTVPVYPANGSLGAVVR